MDGGGCLGAVLVIGAIVLIFGVPLAAIVCIVAAWLYNLFH